MSITIDILALISLIGMTQGFFFALVIYRIGNQKANKFLAAFFFCGSITITNHLLIKTGLYNNYFYLVYFPVNIAFLIGPLFYFYVLFFTSNDYRFQKKDWLHFLPTLIVFLYMLPFYLMNNKKVNHYSTIIVNNEFTPDYYILFVLIICQICAWIYIILTHKMVKQYKIRIKQNLSPIDKINLLWLKMLIDTLILVYISLIGLYFLTLRIGNFQPYDFLGIIVSAAIFFLAYQGMRQPEIFIGKKSNRNYIKSDRPIFSKTEAEYHLERLNQLMEKEKIFRNPDLSLPDLAKQLSISRSMLSQIINEYAKMNFYDYINSFRVQEVKNLLLDQQKSYLTIVAIATEAGFKSKASFNRIFKRFTSMTPSQYLNSKKS